MKTKDETKPKHIHSERKVHDNNTSGYVGVSWSKPTSKWLARIRVDGKSVHLGVFKSKIKAVAARRKAEIHFAAQKIQQLESL